MDECRAQLRSLLSETVHNDKMGHSIEVSAFNACIRQALQKHVPRYWGNCDFRRMYTAKARSLIFNLNDANNPALLQKVVGGSITPKALANLTPQQMHPELWEEAIHKKMVRDVEADPSETPEGIVQCKKCGSKRVQWTQKQTRSAGDFVVACLCYCCLLNLTVRVCVCRRSSYSFLPVHGVSKQIPLQLVILGSTGCRQLARLLKNQAQAFLC